MTSCSLISQTDAVVGFLAAAGKGQMVLVGESRALNLFLEIAVGSQVHDREAVLCGKLPVAVGGEHLQPLIGHGEIHGTVVIDAQTARFAVHRLDVNHTGSATAAILSRLGGILQDGETLDIRGIDRLQKRQVAHHTINDDERIVAARERSGTTQAHGTQGVGAVALHLQTCHTSADGIQGVGGLVLIVHPAFADDAYLAGIDVVEITYSLERI